MFVRALEPLRTREISEEGRWLALRGLDGLPLEDNGAPVRIKLLGPDSKAYKDALREEQRKQERLAASGVEVSENKAAIMLTASVVREWEGFFDASGAPVPCTYDAACLIFEAIPHVFEQAFAFAADRRNFAPASSNA